nr:HEAT repeat domain-containing protein [Nostoc sp. SerVER01]
MIKFANEKQLSVLLAILEVAIMTTLPIVLVASTAQAAHTRLSEVDRAQTIPIAFALINKQACSSARISQTIERLQSQIVEPSQILVECGTAATTPLIQLLEDESKNPLSRRAAARVLGQIGSQDAIAALIRIVQQNRSGIRDSALRAIADINPQARDAVTILTVAIADQNLELSKVGIAALRRIDPAVPNQDIRLRGNVAMAIGLADLESPLIKILEDENQDIALRTDAAIALGFTNGSSVAISSLVKFVRQHPAYHLGLRLSNQQLQEYLFSKLSNDELNLLVFAFATLQKFRNSNQASLFFNQFEQENSVLFSELENFISVVNGADGPAMVRLLQESSQTPAICRITFMQRFLWRCRQTLKISYL